METGRKIIFFSESGQKMNVYSNQIMETLLSQNYNAQIYHW
jgi:hypothetical protein